MAVKEKKVKEKNPDKIGVAKFMGWQARAISLGSMTIVIGYLTIYCTNTLMMPPALVGTLLLVSKIFDGVTDLFAGFLIDNTKTRFGKARPYEFCIIALWLCTWLLFSCPEGWTTTVKAIWIFIMYTFVNSVFATLLTANQTTYMVRAFSTRNQMVKLNSYGGLIITIGCAVVSMTFPTLMANMATSGAGWSKMIAIYAIPLTLIGLLRFVFVKETIDADAGQEKVSFKDMTQALTKNKYVYAIAGITILYNITLGMNASSFYFTYLGGGIEKYTYIAMLSMPMLVFMFIFPVMMKKIPLSRIMMMGGVISALGYALNFFAGDNIALLMVAGALFSLGGLPVAYLSGILVIDCAEYNEHIGLKRMEGTLTALQSFGGKVGGGIGSGMLGILLGWFGYNGAAAVQTESALMGIRLLYSIVPAAMFALLIVVAYFFKLDSILPKMRAEKAAEKAAETLTD